MGRRGPVPKRKAERRRVNDGPGPKDRLYAAARELGIPGRSKMTRRELEVAIRSAGVDPEQALDGTMVAASSPVEAPGLPASMPDPDPDWHPIAANWYRSLGESGQSAFYQASDWALATVVAESMSRELSPRVVGRTGDGEAIVGTPPIPGASLAAYLKAMSALMVSEGERRRAGLELQVAAEASKAEETAGVAVLDEYRAKLRG